MSNNTQQTAPERIWIDPSEQSQHWSTWEAPPALDQADVEYIRADLQQSRAIDFAEWCDAGGYYRSIGGCWKNDDREIVAESTQHLYEFFLKESAG